MKKLVNKALLLSAFALATLSIFGVYAATTTLNMQVLAGSVSITSPTGLSFTGTITASNAIQSLEQNFNTSGAYYFTVQDLKGADAGYNTTLQVSGPLTAGSATIPTSAISFKASAGTPTLLSGTANPRVVMDAGTAAYQNFSSTRTFIVRNNAANSSVLGQYGSQIWLKIDVPAWQGAGTYTTSLVYTLIEN